MFTFIGNSDLVLQLFMQVKLFGYFSWKIKLREKMFCLFYFNRFSFAVAVKKPKRKTLKIFYHEKYFAINKTHNSCFRKSWCLVYSFNIKASPRLQEDFNLIFSRLQNVPQKLNIWKCKSQPHVTWQFANSE